MRILQTGSIRAAGPNGDFVRGADCRRQKMNRSLKITANLFFLITRAVTVPVLRSPCCDEVWQLPRGLVTGEVAAGLFSAVQLGVTPLTRVGGMDEIRG